MTRDRIKVDPSQSYHHICTLNGKIIEKNSFLAANFLYEPIFDVKNFVHWTTMQNQLCDPTWAP